MHGYVNNGEAVSPAKSAAEFLPRAVVCISPQDDFVRCRAPLVDIDLRSRWLPAFLQTLKCLECKLAKSSGCVVFTRNVFALGTILLKYQIPDIFLDLVVILTRQSYFNKNN